MVRLYTLIHSHGHAVVPDILEWITPSNNTRAFKNEPKYNNKFAQSNLGRGPRRGAVAHIRRKVPIGYNGTPQIRPPKVPLSVDRSPNPTTCLIPGPVRPMMPNRIRIRSAVLPQCTGQTDRRTDRQTDRLSTGKLDDYRLLCSESDVA